ncbi:metal-dependent hydrolase [Halonotius roseus]|uniref:Metal-dependent hydrolase n=1 Tax=Halonotius roseus TaxID=2511997 RepID=A0A544QL37_9EURY|nr:metal-dependent hydrolase [Halonotius roseus]TQQ79080.1 metal-dependent hydrolase [Halonotius roseus]
MLFPTHLVVAAGIGVVSRLRATRTAAATAVSMPSQSPLSLGWLVVGAALPDLIDKPLGMAGVTELFHSVGHSAVLLPVAIAVALAGRRGVALVSGRGLALAVGWASHLFLDALHVVINGRPSDALFLGWPVVSPPNPPAIPPGEFFWYYLGSPSFYLEVLLWLAVAALVVWTVRVERGGTNR